MFDQSVSPQLVELISTIERFYAAPIRETGAELAADMQELARGRNLLDLKFSELAAAFARTDHYERFLFADSLDSRQLPHD